MIVEERFESEYKTLYSKYNDVNGTDDYARASQENSMTIPLELSGKDFSAAMAHITIGTPS